MKAAEAALQLGIEEQAGEIFSGAASLPTQECPHGCGAQVIVGRWNGSDRYFDPDGVAYIWLGTRPDGSPLIVGRPSNWLVEHRCPRAS